MSKVELMDRVMNLAATEVANGAMTCRQAAEHFCVDQAVLVHRAEKKRKHMFNGQRKGTYKVA